MNKRAVERRDFEQFLRQVPEAFDRFEAADPPEPDIVAWRGSRAFGIEITAFHRSLEKHREAKEDEIVRFAEERYTTSGGPAVEVSTHWTLANGLTKGSRIRLARALAATVRRHVPTKGNWSNLGWGSLPAELQTNLESLSIYRHSRSSRSYWHAARAAVVADCEPMLLQAMLDSKNDKPPKYRTNYYQLWLLIVSRFGAPSSWLEMTDRASSAEYVSVFHRAFVLSSFPSHRVFELRLGPFAATGKNSL